MCYYWKQECATEKYWAKNGKSEKRLPRQKKKEKLKLALFVSAEWQQKIMYERRHWLYVHRKTLTDAFNGNSCLWSTSLCAWNTNLIYFRSPCSQACLAPGSQKAAMAQHRANTWPKMIADKLDAGSLKSRLQHNGNTWYIDLHTPFERFACCWLAQGSTYTLNELTTFHNRQRKQWTERGKNCNTEKNKKPNV